MYKFTVTLTPEEVVTLREVFHLALIQSEAVVSDAIECLYSDEGDDDFLTRVRAGHRAVVSLMVRIDAMLPDSTGFFED